MTETEPLTREQIEAFRDGKPTDVRALGDAALYYEARLREVEAERDRLQEWTDRVAQTSTDAATAAEKAEAVLRWYANNPNHVHLDAGHRARAFFGETL